MLILRENESISVTSWQFFLFSIKFGSWPLDKNHGKLWRTLYPARNYYHLREQSVSSTCYTRKFHSKIKNFSLKFWPSILSPFCFFEENSIYTPGKNNENWYLDFYATIKTSFSKSNYIFWTDIGQVQVH